MDLASGLINMEDWKKDAYTPSLWAYYETLPTWARNDPQVRNVFMAFEHHKRGMSIRDKEMALNFACSMLKPIEETLSEVIADFCAS